MKRDNLIKILSKMSRNSNVVIQDEKGIIFFIYEVREEYHPDTDDYTIFIKAEEY